MATSLAREKGIDINSNLKKQKIKSDQTVVIKKILMNILKDMIITVVSKFGEIRLIKIQLIEMWQKAVVEFAELDQANLLVSKWSFLIGKDSVHITKAVSNYETWASRDWFRVLLFILPVGTTAHNLGTFLERAGGKTCIINRSLKTGNRICCAVVGFKSDNDLESAFYTELIFGSIKLSWTRMDLFGHFALECDTTIASLFKPLRTFKRVVVSLAGFSDGFYFASGSGSPFFGTSGLNNGFFPVLVDNSSLDVCLASLKQFLELLTNQVSGIKDLVLNIVMDDSELVLLPPFSTSLSVSILDLSSLKVLTTKIGSLESKLVALEASVSSVLIAMCNVWGINVSIKQKDVICWHKDMSNLILIFTETKLKNKIRLWIADKFESVYVFTSKLNSGYLGAGVVVVIDFFLAKHVCKISEVSGRLLFIRLLFKNKLSVSVLGLYAGALSAAQFSQTGEINFFVAKVANRSSFVILGGDFNENGLKRSASFKKCVSLGLVNFMNSMGVEKTIDFVLVLSNLVTVSVFVSLNGLLDTQLNFLHRQANKDHWKFDFKGADDAKWSEFKEATAANAAMLSDGFITSTQFLDLDLELLVSKIAKASHKEDIDRFALFMECWNFLDNIKTSIVQKIVTFSAGFDHVCSVLFSSTIRSILEYSFQKMVLDYLVVKDKLILEPDLSLEYVFDDVFSNVMCLVNFNKLLRVVSNLPDGKAVDLSRVSNELWKHCNKLVLNMLLEEVFINTRPIALIETAPKIFSKILSDRISLACSSFDVLYGDNFSVLKSMTMQSPIFAVGSVIKDALEKNHKLWLVLQNMQKTYNFNSLVRIKMCNKFIRFFGGIYNGCINKVMTDFSLMNEYQESIYGYKMNSYFVIRTGHLESQARLTSFFAAMASLNLSISGLPIFIAKKGESHHYLRIFLLTKDLSRSSLTKADADVKFFANLVLRKTISDKQFLYLVSAVLHPIVSYRRQFSFVPISLKLKSGLPLNFPNNVLCHLSLYDLKTFKQVQAESKVASIVCFANSVGILGHLFLYKFHDLQVLSWSLLHFLASPICIRVSASNNFLASVVYIFLGCSLSLGGQVTNFFCFHSSTSMSSVLDRDMVLLLLNNFTIRVELFLIGEHSSIGKDWTRFRLFIDFLDSIASSPAHFLPVVGIEHLDILESSKFKLICNWLLSLKTDSISVYMDESLKGLVSIDIRAGAVVFFEDISLGLGVRVSDLMFSTLAKLQTITLAFECVLSNSLVGVYSDSQAALNACKSELGIVYPDFRNCYWVEHQHIGYLGVMGNGLADAVSLFPWCLVLYVKEFYILANGNVVFGNSRHFVSLGSKVLDNSLHLNIDWFSLSLVWHSDLHMAAGFTSKFTKQLYNRCYSSVLCLYCDKVEVSDYVFSCVINNSAYCHLLDAYTVVWSLFPGLSTSSSSVSQFLSFCASNVTVCMALCKGFVFKNWLQKAVFVFGDAKIAGQKIVEFVYNLYLAFRDEIWLWNDTLALVSISGLPALLSASVVRLLSIAEAIGVGFGFYKSCLFFTGVEDSVLVHIDV
ncbi:hypothetical protein G9A89_023141 [Geosiphon pyriformis]|nr:hypothetical protein G9A89_023141 [Geosiphon pyriformis]